MQIVGFSSDLRAKLAAWELARETGTLTDAEFTTKADTARGLEMAAKGLKASDGWGWGPTPPAKDNPAGYTMVFWRER